MVDAPEQGAEGLDVERFIADHGDRLMASAYLLTGDREAAEDLVQGALISLLSRPRSVAHPSAYVRRMMLNDYLNHTRRRRHGEDLLRRSSAEALPAQSFDNVIVEREAVRVAVSRLKPRHRAVVVLHYFEDLDEAAIAAALDCAPSTVRSLLSRARGHLRRQLNEMNGVDHD